MSPYRYISIEMNLIKAWYVRYINTWKLTTYVWQLNAIPFQLFL